MSEALGIGVILATPQPQGLAVVSEFFQRDAGIRRRFKVARPVSLDGPQLDGVILGDARPPQRRQR